MCRSCFDITEAFLSGIDTVCFCMHLICLSVERFQWCNIINHAIIEVYECVNEIKLNAGWVWFNLRSYCHSLSLGPLVLMWHWEVMSRNVNMVTVVAAVILAKWWGPKCRHKGRQAKKNKNNTKTGDKAKNHRGKKTRSKGTHEDRRTGTGAHEMENRRTNKQWGNNTGLNTN